MDRVAVEAHERLLAKIRLGLQDKRQRAALYRGTEEIREVSDKAYSELPNGGEALLREARRIKREAIDHLDENLERFIKAASSASVNVHVADDAVAAVRIVVDLARNAGARRIAKSKSMTTEEIDLRRQLEESGFGVVETDLGERIIQLAGQRPAHMVAPAIHMSAEDIAKLFVEETHRQIAADPEQITAIARESLREAFLHADVGITGANFAIADSGAIVLVTNEGNGRLVSALPRMTIAIFGAEKIVGTTADALTLLQPLILSATGQRLTSYITITRGGSKLAETGMQQEQHYVILENGRSRMRADSSFRETLYCLRCGACMDACPTFRLFGGHVFGHIYTGPIGVPWTEYTSIPDLAGEFAPLCISCGLCKQACPMDINIPFLIAQVKERYAGRHGQLKVNRILCNYETFVRIASTTAPISNFALRRWIFRRFLHRLLGFDERRSFPPFTRDTFQKWFHSHASTGSRQVAYFVDTYADMCEPDIGRAVVGILEANDCGIIVPKQVGSGMPSFLYGEIRQTAKAAKFNVRYLAEAVRKGCEVVSSEPTANYCLRELYPRLVGSEDASLVAAHSHDLFEYLVELHGEANLRGGFSDDSMSPVAYHSPCHTRSVYGESNALKFLKLVGVDVRPVRYNTCCGIAGTFGFKHGAEGYDVSMAIGDTLFERLRAMNLKQVVTESSVCKMHIEHGTSLKVLHPATLLWNMYQSRKSTLQ